MDDHQIVKLFYERSEQAIDRLADQYGNLCKSVSYRIVGNHEDAEECVNDTYFAVWNTIPPQNPNPLSAYICKITRNISLKKYRENTAKKRNHHYDMALEEISECVRGHGRAEDSLEAAELTQHINRFLETIKQIDRVIFMERYWFCYEVSEISKNINVSKNYVNVHLNRTKNKLKKYLKTEGYL